MTPTEVLLVASLGIVFLLYAGVLSWMQRRATRQNATMHQRQAGGRRDSDQRLDAIETGIAELEAWHNGFLTITQRTGEQQMEVVELLRGLRRDLSSLQRKFEDHDSWERKRVDDNDERRKNP